MAYEKKYEKAGQPRVFPDADSFIKSFEDYLLKCKAKGKLPNVAGFCVHAKMTRTTFYDYKKHYPKAFNLVDMMLEDAAINAEIKDTFKVFYMKNKFRDYYKDRQEVVNEMQFNNGKLNSILSELGTDDDQVITEVQEAPKE